MSKRSLGAMMTMTDEIVQPAGAVLLQWLGDHGMTQRDAAEAMGYSAKHICAVVKGRVRLTPDFAVALARFTGIPVLRWLECEALYIAQRHSASGQTVTRRRGKRRP